MKKVLFSLAIMATALVSMNAQTVYFQEDFNDIGEELPITWQNIDADGDGGTWNVSQIQDASGSPVFTPLLRSASWASSVGPLNPDNWVITPGIDLSAANTDNNEVVLTYDINAIDADWDVENYTVYVGTSPDPAMLLNSEITFNESTLDGFNEFNEASMRSINVSALAGETIYVAFRHHNVSDQFTIELDNIKVADESLALNDIQSLDSRTVIYPNPVQDQFSLKLANDFNANKVSVKVTNVAGKSFDVKYSENIDISRLPAGVYILTVTDGNKTETQKLIKK